MALAGMEADVWACGPSVAGTWHRAAEQSQSVGCEA